VHLVRGNILNFDRLERAGTHLKIEALDQHTRGRQPLEQLWREMEACSWSGHTPLPASVHRLIARLVQLCRISSNVGRKRQAPMSPDGLVCTQADEPDQSISVRKHFDRFDHGACAECDALAGTKRAAGLPHGHPLVVGGRMDQQDLGWRTGRPGAEQASVPHSGGVEHQEVTGRDQTQEI
jgi:hypothetical protein